MTLPMPDKDVDISSTSSPLKVPVYSKKQTTKSIIKHPPSPATSKNVGESFTSTAALEQNIPSAEATETNISNSTVTETNIPTTTVTETNLPTESVSETNMPSDPNVTKPKVVANSKIVTSLNAMTRDVTYVEEPGTSGKPQQEEGAHGVSHIPIGDAEPQESGATGTSHPQGDVQSQGSDVDEQELDDPLAGHPPIKRLRLRGDWSDTGPNARPEGERPPSTNGMNMIIVVKKKHFPNPSLQKANNFHFKKCFKQLNKTGGYDMTFNVHLFKYKKKQPNMDLSY